MLQRSFEQLQNQFALPPQLSLSATFSSIMTKGSITVGISAGIKGLSYRHNDTYVGFDTDIARAISAAIFIDDRPVDFRIVNPEDRFSALHEDKIDIGLYNASKTLQREIENDVTFPIITLIDGEGILTRKENAGKQLATWQDPILGVQKGTTSPANIKRHRSGLPCRIKAFTTLADAVEALQAQNVDAVIFDTIGLAGALSEMPDKDSYLILPERISRELMGPVVKLHDPLFARAVTWIFSALVHAAEASLRAEDLANPDVTLSADQQWLLERGLPLYHNDLAYKERLYAMIRAVGNYDEIFQRNLGAASGLNLCIGPNTSYSRGGIIHPAPI